MDIVNQIADTDEEEAASVKVTIRMKSRKPKKQKKQEILNAKETPQVQGEPSLKRYGIVRAEKMSCKFCDRPPFRTKIGLAVHMTDEHGVDSDGGIDSDAELEEVGVVMRSSRDIPCHLDYREPDTYDEEEEASENEVSEGEMIEQVTEVVDGVEDSENDEEDEEDVSQGQKRDTASAELTLTPVSKVKKIKRITLGTNRSGTDAEDQNNNYDYVSNFIEETMEEFKRI